jgi:flavin-dependent dehydrogenase
MNERVDCVVIGGGPAGSTAANLLASHGRRVVVLEREHFPRYHIGESLLPGVLPMLDVLGALEEVEAFGFQRKTGQTFCWNPKDPCWELNFHDLERFNYTYFVTRADFDAILLNTARAKGAEVREGCRVRQVRFDGDTAIGVTYEDATGAVVHLDSRYVIDASGSQALLAKRFRLRHFTETMKSFAVWGYYRGFDRIEAQGKQHLLTATFRDGWIWCIPLHDGLTSIGVVTARDLVPEGLNKRAREAWYEGILHGTPAVRDRLQHAERTTGLQVARDWSYRCKRRSGPGWALAGEAGGFIDPLLSYGIQFAMNSSYLAAMAVHNALREPAYSEPFFQYFEDTTRTLYEDLFAAVEAFYSYQCSQDSVYWRTKELVGRERGESPYRSFLYVSAGFLGNEAFGGQPSADTFDFVGGLDTPEDRLRHAIIDASVPGELQPDVLVGRSTHVVAHGVPLTDGDGGTVLYDVVREGFELRLRPHVPPEVTEDEAELAELEISTMLADGQRADIRVLVVGRDSKWPRYREVGAFGVGYHCLPRATGGREYEAVLRVVDRVVTALGELDPDPAKWASLQARLVAALSEPDALPAGALLATTTRDEARASSYRALVLGVESQDDPRDRLWFFLQAREGSEEKTWTRTRSYTLSYQPSHRRDGSPIFDDAAHRAVCAFAAERLHRLDELPDQSLDELAARLKTDLGTRIVPPAPWQFTGLDGISQSGAPTTLWSAAADA